MAGGSGKVPMGVVYGLGFGAITAGRICQEAHLQGFFMRVLGLPPAVVAAGWSMMCLSVAVAEPLIGIAIDEIRNRGVSVTQLLRFVMVPWAALFYLIWRPAANPTAWLFVPVIFLSLLQATLNLGFLSVYPSIFPTKEARARAMVPQQGMVTLSLLMGMTLPAILSKDWTSPLSFSLPFSAALAAALATSLLFLHSWDTGSPPPSAPSPKSLRAASSPLKGAPSTATASRARPGGIAEGLREIAGDSRMSAMMASVFLAQVGNALLASSLPLFCREVVDLSQPIGPFLGGAVPALSSHWQFSVCFALFYFLGGATASWWSRLAQRRGAAGALRLAMRCYAVGCASLALGPGGVLPFLRPVIAASPLNKFLVLLSCYALNGLSLGGLVSLPDVALAEGVKALEAKGGGGKAGKVYGAKQLVYRLGSACQGVATASVIYAVGGSWRVGLPILAGWLPAAFYVLAAQVLPGRFEGP